MSNVRNMSIWKKEEPAKGDPSGIRYMGIEELNLTVRSYNCMRRAGCVTVDDVMRVTGDDGEGLKKIRGLGAKSVAEIREKVEELAETCAKMEKPKAEDKTRHVIRPARKVWDRNIASFRISEWTRRSLNGCGIYCVGDLYETDSGREPGWYAVRELFEKIAE